MAEAAGLILGVIGVAGVFSSCVQAFDMVQIGQTQTHHLRILATKLDNQKARFIIWGKALGLDGDQQYDSRLNEPLRKEQIMKSCELIHDLFTKSSLLTTRYGLRHEAGASSNDILQLNNNESSAWKITFRRMRTRLSSNNPQSTQRLHVTRWIIQDQKDFLSLVNDLRELIDDLESLTAFRDIEERQRFITTYEVESIPDDGSIQILEESTIDERGLISDAVSVRASSGSRSTQQETFYTASEGLGASNGLRARIMQRGKGSGTNFSWISAPFKNSSTPFTTLPGISTLQNATREVAPLEDTSEALGNIPQHERIMRDLKHGPAKPDPIPFGALSAEASEARETLTKIHAENFQVVKNDEMGVTRSKRLRKELEHTLKYQPLPASEFVTFGPVPGCQGVRFRGTIVGPAQTPYEGGVFHLLVLCCKNYPYHGPVIRFFTKVYHPNIDAGGKICLNILDEWSAALTVPKTLISITSLLAEPSVDNPLVPEIASTFVENRQRYDDNAKAYAMRYARGVSFSQEAADIIFNVMKQEHLGDEHNSIAGTCF